MLDYLKGLSHVTFTCKDFPAMRSFYRDTLGLKELFVLPYNNDVLKGFQESGYHTSDLKAGDIWISYMEVAPKQFVELFHLPYNGNNERRNIGFRRFGLRVDDIAEAARELKDKGVALYGESMHSEKIPIDPAVQGKDGSLSFYIRDPEGNEIEIIQYTKESFQTKCRI